ncbi:MAG: TetR/AcrR family transcriptional regulator [Actinomycetota bacterium]
MSSDRSYGDPETRRRILEATHEVVVERGSRLKLSDVADRADVSRQAVYLHFGDRTQLLVALVQHMDESLHLGESLARVQDAPTNSELIERTMQLHASFSAAIDPIALILDAAQYEDEALGTAWRDRLRFRHQVHRDLIERIADEGSLADGWTPDTAADVFYAITLPGPWRELTQELGWTSDQYVLLMTTVLQRALLADPPVPNSPT